VKVADIIRAPKADLTVGEWKSGKVTNAAFPLGRALPYGPSWQWRVVEFRALGKRFYVLILLNPETEYYSAVLAMEHHKGLQVICHHELHTSHRRWHCHFVPGDSQETFPNVLRDRDRMVAWPSGKGSRWTESFPVTKATAYAHAARRYRLSEEGGLF
jgi:hypothetical protein